MNFEQLIYVKSVYEQESMIRASELMHISQSAMSQSIANLETELGYSLFYRPERDSTDRNWQTIDSKILEILEAKEHLMLEVERLQTHITGKLTIATIPTLFHKLLPKVISQFKVDYPNVDIEVIESDRENIIKC